MTILGWAPRHLMTRAPWREMDRMRAHMEGMLEALSSGIETIRQGGAGVYPSVNLSEDSENLYLVAELPGVTVENLDLSVEGQSLTLRGERTEREGDRELNYHRRERDTGYFRRVVSLPVRVQVNAIQATLKNGILRMTLPKAEEAKARRISVQPA